jgi:selenocysteine-specific elongation factor
VAINLTGVSRDEVWRGELVTVPGWLRPTTLVDCTLRYLADASGPLKHNAQVDFFCGAAEAPAWVRLLDKEILAPGDEGWVQIRLAAPIALVKGDRFIIRQPSPSVTIGGGVVINPFPGRRHQRFRAEVTKQLETLAHGTPEEILVQALERQQPVEAGDLLARSSLPRQQAREALQALVGEGQILVLESKLAATPGGISGQPVADAYFVVTRSGWGELRERIEGLLSEYHQQFPLRSGMPREEVKSRLALRQPALTPRLFNEIVALGIAQSWLAEDANTLRLATHQATFTPKQQQQVDYMLYLFRQNPYTTPSVAQCEEMVGGQVLNALIEQSRLIRLNEEVVLMTETYEQMRDRIVAFLHENERITVAQVRDLFGTSRKYALALVNTLDEKRITRRVGDDRVLR